MKKYLLSIACILVLSVYAMGQNTGVKIDENATITQLNDYFIQYNMKKSEWPGWRVQVFVSADRREMESTLANFRNKFPGYYARWTLNDPYYQIKAGTFIDYAEAMRSLQDIRRSFRSATLISDRIRREEVLNL